MQRQVNISSFLALLICTLFYLAEFVARVEPSLAPEALQAYFKLNNSQFGTFASLFFFVYAPMQIFVGLLLDRFGAKRFVILGAAACGAGTLLLSTAANIYLAGAGRMLTGFGASFAFVSALYVINHLFPTKWFTTLSGLINMVGMLGTAIGVIGLSHVIKIQGWQFVFHATGIICFILAVFAIFLIPHAPQHIAKKAKNLSFLNSLEVVVTNRHIWLVALLGLFFYVPINVFGTLWGNDSLQHLQGFSKDRAEEAVSALFFGMAFGSLIIGFLSSHFGHRKWLIIVGSVLANVSFVALIFTPYGELKLWVAEVLLFTGGFFCGAQMLTFAMAKDSCDGHIAATAMAFTNMLGIGGAIVFQPFFGWLLDYSSNHFVIALMTIPASLILTTLLGLMTKDTHLDKN